MFTSLGDDGFISWSRATRIPTMIAESRCLEIPAPSSPISGLVLIRAQLRSLTDPLADQNAS
jgi:hypothetical protein